MTTIEDVRRQRTALHKETTQKSIVFLKEIGNYYEQTRPSKIEHIFVFETEMLINDLYVKSLGEPSSHALTAPLLEALGQIGSLAISVQNKTFGTDYVTTAKQLGRTLIRISRMR